MQTIIHEHGDTKIVEVVSDATIINTAQDALDLMMNFLSLGMSKMIFHKKNINPDFFSLSTGFAGEIAQKFVNYGAQLAIVGDFANLTSKSLNAFILESNRGNQLFFLENTEAAQKIMLHT